MTDPASSRGRGVSDQRRPLHLRLGDARHPVDQFLPVPKLLTLGLQHVLVMYAGAVAVPLILGRALNVGLLGIYGNASAFPALASACPS